MKKILDYFALPGTILAPLVFALSFMTALYILFTVSDSTSYWASAILFVIGSLISYHVSRTAGIDGALALFREIIIGSINIGLTSIKKLADTPPKDIATQTKSSLVFIGIAGEKFLKKSMDECEFFRKNKTKHNVRLILMDPFCDDIKRLSKNKQQQMDYRRKIIATLCDLDALRNEGFVFDVRLYPRVPPLRLLISDNTVTTMSIYTMDTNGWKNAQLIFDTKNCPDSLAPYFFDLFEDLWERALGINVKIRAAALKGLLLKGVPEDAFKLGMVHGRFQPFHHEHLEYVLYGITHSKKCLIGITQPNIEHIAECEIVPHRGKPEGNPFSFEERRDMIKLSLDDLGIDSSRYDIIEFDVDNINISIPDLQKKLNGELPVQFMKVFSDWELHKKHKFEKLGLSVKVIRDEANQFSQKNVTGTLVRELISSNRNWRDFVPTGTKEVVTKRPQIIKK